ncbi:MAG: hypothetical protein KAR12_04020, partial [Methylococcales bacterium]|nr:hypothetical protein [Methylococcales bacterium]
YPGKTDKPKREVWLNERCTQLKHDSKAVEALIEEMEQLAKADSTPKCNSSIHAVSRSALPKNTA